MSTELLLLPMGSLIPATFEPSAVPTPTRVAAPTRHVRREIGAPFSRSKGNTAAGRRCSRFMCYSHSQLTLQNSWVGLKCHSLLLPSSCWLLDDLDSHEVTWLAEHVTTGHEARVLTRCGDSF